MENEFVKYLNTLHSYNGHNSNAFGEKNYTSKFYDDLMVPVPLGNFIVDKMTDSDGKIIMLTGHAGDGKTSLMYQVLKSFGCIFDAVTEEFEVSLPDGSKCLCIKDFSEFPDEEKLSLIQKSKKYQEAGNYVFMVANTGPLINTFIRSFPESERDQIEGEFIEALDTNSGETVTIGGYKICIINIVKTENTYFANQFLDKVLSNKAWDNCDQCSKKGYCHILRNRQLMVDNKVNTFDFINKHYIWLHEYGKRLTIRNMTQQLAFMFTGGYDCEEVKDNEPYLYLYTNLFFGFIGRNLDGNALKIPAIAEAANCKYEEKRLRVDETLFIKEDYNSLFSKDVVKIIEKTIKQNGYCNGFNEMFKRLYFFCNMAVSHEIDDEDIFSKQFDRYVELKYNHVKPSKKDNSLVKSALQMIYTGRSSQGATSLPVTFNRESGYTQNVQFVLDDIKLSSIQLKTFSNDKLVCDTVYEKDDLRIVINRQPLRQDITLPLFDYFEELKNGVINTNIDAQLSKGIENIKAEILDIVLQGDPDDDSFSLIVMKDDGDFDQKFLQIDEGRIS